MTFLYSYIISMVICIIPFLYYRIYLKDNDFYIFSSNPFDFLYMSDNDSRFIVNFAVGMSIIPVINGMVALIIVVSFTMLKTFKFLEFLVKLNKEK